MKTALKTHSNRISDLRDRVESEVNATLETWTIRELITDRRNLIEGLIQDLMTQVTPILRDALSQGQESGREILKTAGGSVHRNAGVNFLQLVNTTLRDMETELVLNAETFAQYLQLEARKMQSRGISDTEVWKVIEADWNAQHRGKLSSRVWSGSRRIVREGAVRLFQLGSLAARFGVKLGI